MSVWTNGMNKVSIVNQLNSNPHSQGGDFCLSLVFINDERFN